jgi:glycine/D-amino acid oxidase-like deaminating enzyme
MTTTVGYLVIGGGITGLSIARELRQRRTGARVVVLKKGRAFAFCVLEPPSSATTRPRLLAAGSVGGGLPSYRAGGVEEMLRRLHSVASAVTLAGVRSED